MNKRSDGLGEPEDLNPQDCVRVKPARRVISIWRERDRSEILPMLPDKNSWPDEPHVEAFGSPPRAHPS